LPRQTESSDRYFLATCAFVDTNPTNQSITSRLLVIRQEKAKKESSIPSDKSSG